MRDEVLIQLVDKAMTDPQFRDRALEDLDAALSEHGFELEEDELAAVREFHAEVAGKSPEEVDGILKEAASGNRRQQGG